MTLLISRKHNIEVVIFDAGGTLIGFNDATPFYNFLIANTPLNYPQPTLKNAFILMKRAEEKYNLALKEKINQKKPIDTSGLIWYKVFKELWPESEVVANSMFNLFIKGHFNTLYEDVIPTLKLIASRSIKMGVLSNFSPTLEGHFKDLCIHHFFSFFVVSSLVNLRKPDREIFELAIKMSGCSKDKILYVGDNIQTDIEGAKAVGLKAVLIDRDSTWNDVKYIRLQSLRDIHMLI